jgi:hypothetical protein
LQLRNPLITREFTLILSKSRDYPNEKKFLNKIQFKKHYPIFQISFSLSGGSFIMIRFILKTVVASVLSLFVITSYAIEVNVKTNADKVTGIGFTVNGKKHGGMGSSYKAKDMPADADYTFGLRIGTQDIGCKTEGGDEAVKLSADSNIELSYTDGKCTLKM